MEYSWRVPFLINSGKILFGQLNIFCTRGESGAGKTENTKKVEIYSILTNKISEIITFTISQHYIEHIVNVQFNDVMKDDHDPECDQIGFDDFEYDQSYR